MEQNGRRQFIQGLTGATALGATLNLVNSEPAKANQSVQTKRPPNILYIHSHDTGRYVQPYGYAIPTPSFQKLAEQGVVFHQAFNVAPTCSPSRASLLTGQYPHQNGMLGLAHRGFALTDYKRHICHTLRAAGYQSTLIGLQHIANDPQVIGYDHVVKVPGNRAAAVAPEAARFLRDSPRQPFFLDVGIFETHREFPAPGPEDDARYARPPAILPDTPQTRQDMAAFKASARALDQALGNVLEALEVSGLAENTLVISTTDHGIAFPQMKCNLTHHGTGVLLIMRGPGGFTGGKTSDALVSQLDIFPTICELAQAKPPAWIEGRSLLPLVTGAKREPNEQLIAQVNYHAAYEPGRAIRTKRYSYVRRFGDQHTPVLPNCDDGPSKSLWLEYGWRNRVVPSEELYDLMFDPEERQNLALDPKSQPALEDMRRRLDTWMKAKNDPILRGPIPAPPGAKINNPLGTSPKEPVTSI